MLTSVSIPSAQIPLEDRQVRSLHVAPEVSHVFIPHLSDFYAVVYRTSYLLLVLQIKQKRKEYGSYK